MHAQHAWISNTDVTSRAAAAHLDLQNRFVCDVPDASCQGLERPRLPPGARIRFLQGHLVAVSGAGKGRHEACGPSGAGRRGDFWTFGWRRRCRLSRRQASGQAAPFSRAHGSCCSAPALQVPAMHPMKAVRCAREGQMLLHRSSGDRAPVTRPAHHPGRRPPCELPQSVLSGNLMVYVPGAMAATAGDAGAAIARAMWPFPGGGSSCRSA